MKKLIDKVVDFIVAEVLKKMFAPANIAKYRDLIVTEVDKVLDKLEDSNPNSDKDPAELVAKAVRAIFGIPDND